MVDRTREEKTCSKGMLISYMEKESCWGLIEDMILETLGRGCWFCGQGREPAWGHRLSEDLVPDQTSQVQNNWPRLARPQSNRVLGLSPPEPGTIIFFTTILSKSQGKRSSLLYSGPDSEPPTCISCHDLSNLAAQVAQLILQLCGAAQSRQGWLLQGQEPLLGPTQVRHWGIALHDNQRAGLPSVPQGACVAPGSGKEVYQWAGHSPLLKCLHPPLQD